MKREFVDLGKKPLNEDTTFTAAGGGRISTRDAFNQMLAQRQSRGMNLDIESVHSQASPAPINQTGVTPTQNAIAGAGTSLRNYSGMQNAIANIQMQSSVAAKAQAAQNPQNNPTSTAKAVDSRGNTKPISGSQVQSTSGTGSLQAAERSNNANSNANAALRSSVQAKAASAQSNVTRQTNQSTPTSAPAPGATNNVGGLRAAERSARAQTNLKARNAAMNNSAANQETANRQQIRNQARTTASIQRGQTQRSSVQSQYGAGGRGQAQTQLSPLRIRQIAKGAQPVTQADVDAPNAGATEVNNDAQAMRDGYSYTTRGTNAAGETVQQANARAEAERFASLPAAERIKITTQRAAEARASAEARAIHQHRQAYLDLPGNENLKKQVELGNQELVGGMEFVDKTVGARANELRGNLPGPDTITTGGSVTARVPKVSEYSTLATGRAADASELFAFVPGGAAIKAPGVVANAPRAAGVARGIFGGGLQQLGNIVANLTGKKAVGTAVSTAAKVGTVSAPAAVATHNAIQGVRDTAVSTMQELNPNLTQSELESITPGYLDAAAIGLRSAIPGIGLEGAGIDAQEIGAVVRSKEAREAIDDFVGQSVGTATTGVAGQMITNADRFNAPGSQAPGSAVQSVRDTTGGLAQGAVDAGLTAGQGLLPQGMQDAIQRETSERDQALIQRMTMGVGLEALATASPEDRALIFANNPAMSSMTQDEYRRRLEGAAAAGNEGLDMLGPVNQDATTATGLFDRLTDNMTNPLQQISSRVRKTPTGNVSQQRTAAQNKMQGRLAGPDVIVGNTLSRNQR